VVQIKLENGNSWYKTDTPGTNKTDAHQVLAQIRILNGHSLYKLKLQLTKSKLDNIYRKHSSWRDESIQNRKSSWEWYR
jgi:hypothetical protein